MLSKKKFCLFVPILILMASALFSGCSNNAEKLHKPEPRILLANSSFVQEYENMQYLLDAVQRKDEDYLKQLILENKVFYVDKDTHVDNIGNMADINHEVIIFKEGRYTNKKGITLKNSLLTEEKYSEHIKEKTRQERGKVLISYISDVFSKSDKLSSYLETDSIYVLNSLAADLKTHINSLSEISTNTGYDSNAREMSKKAYQIIKKRYDAVYNYVQYLKNKDSYQRSIKFLNLSYESAKTSINLRESFEKQYGF